MPSVLTELRGVCPARPLNLGESLRVAELQAARLLRQGAITAPAVPSSLIADLPRLQVVRLARVPVSGSVHWAKSRWVIVLCKHEPATRQRFSLAHEFKHVLDATFGPELLYPGWRGMSTHDRSELVANHFAACLLMPRVWIKRAFYDEAVREPGRLARRFHVSRAAMEHRLDSLGLSERRRRCGLEVAA